MRTARAALAAALICLCTSATPAFADEVANFVSAPSLKPPTLIVNQSSKGQAPGYIFTAVFQNKFFTDPLVGQGGPMILDSKAHYVWLKPASKSAPDTLNLQAQIYNGKPVLTYWDGTVTNTGEMHGQWHVLDNRYKEISTIKDANGWNLSGHEFFITKQGTALITGYKLVEHQDLTSMGGSADQSMLDSGVLEYDIKTGKLVKEWSFLAHGVPITDSYSRTAPTAPATYDPYHINSIDVGSDGSWLVSNRNTWALYKINPSTGAITWILGGKRSDFAVPADVAFAFQHDARFQGANQISIFDNDCCRLIPQPSGPPQSAPPEHGQQTRGLLMNVDEAAKTVSTASERKLYDLTSGTQGNQQFLPNGNVFMGWGQQPFFSEYSKTGKLLLSVRFPDPDESYRAYRYVWKGAPTTRPAAAARVSGKRVRVYASWNGATEVAAWRILGGKSSRKLKVLAKKVSRIGFESAKTVSSSGPIFEVQALNKRGKVIGTSRAVRKQNTSGNTPSPQY